MERRRARARLVSASLFADPQVLVLRPQLQAIALWVALIVTADTSGRTEGEPLVLRKTILSEVEEDDWTEDVIESLLQQMSEGEHPLIKWYHVGRRRYVELLRWTNHQHFSRPTMPEHPANDELAALQARIVTEIPRCRHNLHALAARMWKTHKQPEQIIEALRAVAANAERIKNPWAYIQHAGFLSVSLSRGIEAEADRDRHEEKTAARSGLESVADVLSRISKGGEA